MSFWEKWRQKKRQKRLVKAQALALHDQVVDHLLALVADNDLGVEDDFDLRFDLMVFFVSHILFKQRKNIEFSHELWEVTFEGFRESLRLRGVNDVRMGARMKQALHDATGRRNVYVVAWEESDDQGLRKAIARNILNGAKISDGRIDLVLAGLKGLPGIKT